MNREIKFRRWDTDEKYMYYDKPFHLDTDTNRYTVMQFTGLKDRGGKEIYEGDVFEIPFKNEFGSFEKKRVAVMYCSHEGNWSLSETPHNPEAHHLVMTGNVSKLHILGNIYENPELLKK